MIDGVSFTSQMGYTNASDVESSRETGRDDFLKLLTFQLKAQNPMKPYDNQEFAAQLAQFSQLEQLLDIKSLIEEQTQTNMLLSQTISNSALPGLLGKNAGAVGSEFNFDGENASKIGFELPYNVDSAELIVRNAAGTVVDKIDLSGSNLKSGEHKLEWEGVNSDGEALPAGDYSFEVKAYDGSGSFSADTFIYGRIEAVRFKSEGTALVLDGREIPLENFKDISVD